MKGQAPKAFSILLSVLMLLALSAPLAAQTSRGTVTGSVTDPTGAVIQGATAELRNVETNQTRTSTTNDAGIYRFDAVDLGNYELKITAQGFKVYTARGITIQANRIATFDALLETGGTEVIVEVNAGTEELLQKSDSVRGGNFDRKEITSLPLGALNPYEIGRLLPGVILPAGTTNFGNAGSSGFSINGSRPRGNNYLLDGAENNDISVTGPAVTPNNEDAIAEVSLQTGLFSAEFGRAGGGVFNQITRSGTNQFHGTGRWLYLSQAFNALTNGNRISNLKRPPVFTNNIFGGTFGGPIKKDRTFFFGAAQWDRFRSTSNFAGFVVPTANGLTRLRQLFPSGANPRVDLYLRAFDGLVGVTNPTQVALGRAPGSTVDRGSIEFGGIGIPAATISDSKQFQGRVDHTLSENHRLSFRYIFDDSITTPSNISNPGFIQDFNGRSQNYLMTYTWVMGPTMTNELRGAFGRISFNFPISPSSVEDASTLAKVNIQGITGYGIETNIPQFRKANNYLIQDTASKVWGAHTLRFGGEYLRQIADQRPPFVERGVFNFLGSGGFSGFANYLDNFSGFRATANKNFGDPIYHPNLDRVSLFFQDTWKVSLGLTLTLGVRYENFGQPANKAFKFPAINLDPATFLTPNKVASDNNNFGPVIGFAWTPRFETGLLGKVFGSDKTVLRGGYQVSYDTYFNNLLSNIQADSPNTISTTFTDGSTGSAGTSRGTANFFPNALPSTARTPTPLDQQTSLFNPNIRNPYTQRFSFGIQRQLGWKTMMDLSYVGTLGRKLFVTEDINPFVAPGVRRFPQLGIRRMRTNGVNSEYNALQVRVDKAFSRGLQLQTSYTWSKNIDNNSEVFATTNSGSALASLPVFQGGLALDRAVSDFDRRHVFTVGYIWEIPGPSRGLLGQIAGGWQLAGTAVFQSGAPYTLLNGSDRNGDGVIGLDRPDIGNPNAPHNTRGVIDTRGPSRTPLCGTGLFNPDLPAGRDCVTANDVFVVQGVGLPNSATIGRNTERSNPVNNFNTSLFKAFRLSERFKLEYRVESFNTFNHPQFTGVPGISVAGSLANRYQNFNLLNGGGRTARMALKLIF
jgi:carboxypeptidase family protein/TonB-dependent receptor-like protein